MLFAKASGLRNLFNGFVVLGGHCVFCWLHMIQQCTSSQLEEERIVCQTKVSNTLLCAPPNVLDFPQGRRKRFD